VTFPDIFSGIGHLVIQALNEVIKALGVLASAALAILPAMPSFPSLPSQFTEVMGWINWFFPVGTVFDIAAFLVTAWLIWMVVRVALHWAKVITE
jgi:hypothetical protein